MNHPRKISPDLTTILLNRIFLSRQLKLFTLTHIAENWTISPRTLFRYDSPRDRALSVVAAKRATMAYKQRNKSLCGICTEPLLGHSRCLSCTMLLHGEPECACVDSTGLDILILQHIIQT